MNDSNNDNDIKVAALAFHDAAETASATARALLAATALDASAALLADNAARAAMADAWNDYRWVRARGDMLAWDRWDRQRRALATL